MKVLLDTNAYVAFRRGHSEVVELVRNSETVVLSVVVVGELLFGFRNGSKFGSNVGLLERFLDHPQVRLLDITFETAERFGILSSDLKRRGSPIPTNDVWIASHVFESGTELVTFDRHFERIDSLPRTVLSY